jgi:hypothetical protein
VNVIERRFRNLTDKRIRHGSFKNVLELSAAIRDYLDHHNQNPRVLSGRRLLSAT